MLHTFENTHIYNIICFNSDVWSFYVVKLQLRVRSYDQYLRQKTTPVFGFDFDFDSPRGKH